MELIKLLNLNSIDAQIFSVVGLRQPWKNHSKFVYLDTPRPDNGLTIILCREARYTLTDGRILHGRRNSVISIPQGCWTIPTPSPRPCC